MYKDSVRYSYQNKIIMMIVSLVHSLNNSFSISLAGGVSTCGAEVCRFWVFSIPDTNTYFVHQEGKSFMDAVFNETINITESDEGIDGET